MIIDEVMSYGRFANRVRAGLSPAFSKPFASMGAPYFLLKFPENCQGRN